MGNLLVLLYLTSIIAFIIGMIKPSLILRWIEKPSRIKVFGFWMLSIVVLGILGVIFIATSNDAKKNIRNANKEIENGNYTQAISELKEIKENDSLYNNAQLLIKKADSLNNLSDDEKAKAKELFLKKEKEENDKKQKEQLKREITSINKGVKIGNGKTISSLQMDIVLFGTWAKLIEESENSIDKETKKLSKQLKSKVSRIQIREFPKLRKRYTEIVADKMWENDIKVHSNGRGRKYINFSGGVFARNKNKQDFQNNASEELSMFRFKQSRYRWYEGADEYTYYTIFEGKDSDLVTFNK